MQIVCPGCSTQFAVPDHAIGETGRMVRCARCGHKWHYVPDPAAAHDAPEDWQAADLGDGEDEARPSFGTTADQDETADQEDVHPADGTDDAAEIAASIQASLRHETPAGETPAGETPAEEEPVAPSVGGFDTPPRGGFGAKALGDAPSPKDFAFSLNDAIAEKRAAEGAARPKPKAKEAPKEKSRGLRPVGIVLILLVMILGAVAGAAIYFQEKILTLYPPAASAYKTLGLLKDAPGAGLMFRDYRSERPVQDGVELLIVRGVIVNTTEQSREIPYLQLSLRDANGQTLQEKVVRPPVATLAPSGTAGFRIVLEQPNPDAVHFNLTFTSQKPASGTSVAPADAGGGEASPNAAGSGEAAKKDEGKKPEGK